MSQDVAKNITIPGTFTACLGDNGEIVAYQFSPSASYAGYFGPAAVDAETGEDVGADLPDRTQAPFWEAVRKTLDISVRTHEAVVNVPVEWTE